MNNNLLKVSLSPHISGKGSVKSIMYGVIIALMPAFIAGLYFFGIGALRVTLTAVVACVLFEYVIQKYLLKVESTISDGSAIITGLLLAYNVPSNLPPNIIILGSLVAIGIAKMSFGGLGNNPFNPALVGRVFLLISFPVDMTSWPKPILTRASAIDAVTAATPLAIVKEGLAGGTPYSKLLTQIPSYWDLFIGNVGGCIGEVSALALIIGLFYMLYKKIITWHIPVSMTGSIFIFTGIMCLINPQSNADPFFHILTGGVLLGAIFMATDMVTSPMTPKGMLIFGSAIGILTVIIRVFGAYPEGVSFSILIMNAFVPLINKFCKPKRFGEIIK
ncbi:MAG: Na+-transporting NADH:ubiquinone oxidoreductase subunit D [Omnitrophica WOR_2 bacterium GWF2_38_59]|nr:MAG: Na+-transporting NADH:ubiquinone oxidoreductase subunit D [Omnitrophica WOR_2 bacterium GWF2_38_59]OGX51220.1 MAG: Na+-transporting NADH:ubiquinone oxidoreductase subunit D [Omnitrophica WOR_2 bacterium RIFOXYA2_FULL_38_17]OGX54799.1 MAG: Na+-transporting NADH:ubiquinone oxidoreductase subunit D [Omnitrophica WOR_2 bacterium RIFOXYA12_FULL_38_10]OGX55341.1 MAG: Na+-transporting NADH:ubiquinone oxidoreductase subunit D [Omnitrophica WOR_2 bacterium RIFOXYB2_FULL_38_16]OGX57930.1 MAG: Na+